jgi:TolB-like protein/cytochrome c-type biogenesis protein CcmH/NrfG
MSKKEQQAPKPGDGRQAQSPEVHASAFPIRSGFFAELKRRNVARMAILYLIACWVILEPTHVVFHMLNVPEWANRLVIILMAIGFPLVVLFAWVFEITPEGLKLTSEVDRARSITRDTGRKLDRAIIAVLALAVVYLLVDKFWLSRLSEGTRTEATAAKAATGPAAAAPGSTALLAGNDKSIAVLPFVDISEKKDQEYFSDGLSEELIDHLAHSPDLKVIARTSSFQFKGRNEDVRTIAGKLGVAHLLEGSVRKDGKILRITAQLIRASDGTHLWSQTYERNVSSIFKVQDEIAGTVAGALKVALSGGDGEKSAEANPEAYNALLRGKYFLKRLTKEDNAKALAAFREAIRLDPAYALAWVRLAEAYNQQGIGGWMPPQQIYAEARKALEQALKLDPALGDAYHMLGAIEWNYNFDFAAAGAAMRRGVQLDPNVAIASNAEVTEALAAGHTGEGVTLARRRVERDPLDVATQLDLAFALATDDRFDEAEKVARTVLELDPRTAGSHAFLAAVLLAQRRPDMALSALKDETDEGSRLATLTDVLWALGRHQEADGAMRELQAKYSGTQAYSIAESYALRQDKDGAFAWLDRAYRNREAQITLMRSDWSLRSLREDPRYHTLLVRMKLDDEHLLTWVRAS